MLQIEFPLRAKPGRTSSTSDVGRLPVITRALALAIYMENLIQKGEASNYADVARLYCLSRERVSQVVRLNYLAPDIQVEVLYLPPTETGKYPISEVALRKIANVLSWPEQRKQWAKLKRSYQLGE